jgi:hypothetical protein
VAALAASPDRLLKDLEWLGLLFETHVLRDLRVLAQALDGEVFHYRDNDGVEVDADRAAALWPLGCDRDPARPGPAG